jgi:hypothetical protein
MKTYRILIAAIFAVLALAAYAIADTGPVKITGTPRPISALDMKDASGVLHEYYIGLHSPGEKCFTKVIKAQSLSEAVRKGMQSCRECTVYDLTGNFTGKDTNTFARQNMNYCPISQTRE